MTQKSPLFNRSMLFAFNVALVYYNKTCSHLPALVKLPITSLALPDRYFLEYIYKSRMKVVGILQRTAMLDHMNESREMPSFYVTE